jgi:hypothetical protein
MSYTQALLYAFALYGENWFRSCTIRYTRASRTELVYAVFNKRPSLKAFRRVE